MTIQHTSTRTILGKLGGQKQTKTEASSNPEKDGVFADPQLKPQSKLTPDFDMEHILSNSLAPSSSKKNSPTDK